MKISCWAITHPGRRIENQDAIGLPGLLVEDEGEVVSLTSSLTRDGSIVAVADGVGGRPHGRWAARVAVESLVAYTVPQNKLQALKMAIETAHKRVLGRAVHGQGPATTLAGISVSREGVNVFNIGDSRVYQVQQNAVQRITNDHVSQTDSRAITRFLGGSTANSVPHIHHLEAKTNVAFLISTDGFHQFLRDTDLFLLQELAPPQALSSLLNMALDNGSDDNLSAIFCRID